MTQVALLWHMHQPSYEDLVTREHILPWVRMHALKDYYGMAALLGEFPAVRMTFNLVPSLLVQLEAFAAGRARDRYLEVGLKPATDLSPDDVAFMLESFFHAQRARMIDAHPRYGELLALRGERLDPAEVPAVARRFSTDDLRDLQVWQKLAWIDPSFDADPRVQALVERGRRFTEEDKDVLRAVELELLNAVIPEYRAAADRGQIEISTSPFYHPILPLLCDTGVYDRTHPDAPRPRHPFAHPEDAAEQIARAVACHERLFGRPPHGLWPSEGSVSDAIVPLVERAGFAWMATDELILARTLDTAFTRDGRGVVDQPERLYRPYTVKADGAQVVCLFRDHVLSDRIGFVYAGWAAEQAADDFVERLAEAGRGYAERTGGGEAVLPIILDGENAWEHFEGNGRPFLRALYARLSRHPELRTVTLGEAAHTPGPTLTGIFPGSWIDANFSIWIGHDDDRRAWSQLSDARQMLDEAAGQAPADAFAKAREEILIAEGSDWFWWYGDDHSSDQDAEFDDLFRRHLRNAYHLLDRPVPGELFVTNITTGPDLLKEAGPIGWVSPAIDGEETSYFEWMGAGVFEARDVGGAMHRQDRPAAILTLLHVGFDAASVYLRLDSRRPVGELLRGAHEIAVRFLAPEGLRYTVSMRQGQVVGSFWERRNGTWTERGAGQSLVAAGTILEVGLPRAELGLPDRLSLFVTLANAAGEEVEQYPVASAIDLRVPNPGEPVRGWTA